MVNSQQLESFELFKGLGKNELNQIAELSTQFPLFKNQIVYSRGKIGVDVHLIVSGSVAESIMLPEPWNKEVQVYESHGGDSVGSYILVPPYKYAVSAVCIESGQEIRISGNKLREYLEKNRSIGFIVMSNLAAEIRSKLDVARMKLSVEWLAGSPTSNGSNVWGELSKR